MAKQIDLDQEYQAWQSCHYCPLHNFKTPPDFIRHLRERHCSKEGGSYVCRYGYNGVCPSLPLDGVSDRDYETHISRHHVAPITKNQEQWSVYSAAQNLPAVLNDPNKGKQATFFTKIWGDAFVETAEIPKCPYLPIITWDNFEPYIRKVGRRLQKHSKLLNSKLETTLKVKSQNSELSVFKLKDIPDIFLKPDLKLNEATTFNTIYPNIVDAPDNASRSGRLLQEKLSHYLDVVEVQIAQQVSQKSYAFFHAMTSHDAMMEQMNHAEANVRAIRSKIQNIDATLVKDSLKILSFERSRCNHSSVLEKLKLMSTVHQTQPMIQLLLSTPDYVAALDLISTTQEILSQELAGVHSFRHLPSQLTEMERLIDKILSTEFEKYAAADLNRPLTEFNTSMIDSDKLISTISGLLRQKNFTFIDAYKEEAITTVKAIVKQMVIEIIASSDAEICLTGSGEQQVQTLSLSEWLALLETATLTLERLVLRVKAVHDVMFHTACSSTEKQHDPDDSLDFSESETFLNKSEFETVEKKLSDLLNAVCDYCHERCANLVTNQSLDKSTVTIRQIARLSEIVTTFTQQCEQICGKECIALKAAFKAQASRYVQKFHTDKKAKLALLLDSEQWKQAEVPSEFQTLIDGISSTGSFAHVNPLSALSNGGGGSSGRSTPTSEPSKPAPVLQVAGEPFAVVGTVLLLVQIISEYCRSSERLAPMMSQQYSRNLSELLRSFNSRCCQLVLGAGAIHVAGLKTITSSNLALVSRALQLILWLLPYVREHFRPHTDVSWCAAVERDLISHVQEISDKIQAIVSKVIGDQLILWDARPPIPSKPFRKISLHLVKLHEAIAPILPRAQIHRLYRTVHRNFKDKLRDQLLRNNITNDGSPQHGVVTSELMFYLETLRTLKAISEEELADGAMDDIWLQ